MATKIAKFDKRNLVLLRAELDAALAAVGENFGLKINAGSCSFSEVECTFKLKCAVDDPKAQDEKNQKDFDLYCSMYGLEPRHLGTVLQTRNGPMTFVGLELRRRKYPLKFRGTDGKIVLYTEMMVAAIKAAAVNPALARVRSSKGAN